MKKIINSLNFPFLDQEQLDFQEGRLGIPNPTNFKENLIFPKRKAIIPTVRWNFKENLIFPKRKHKK